MKRMTSITLALALGLLVSGCESTYYSAWEKLGKEKRDLLVDRVEDAMSSQQDAKEEFKDALEQFSSVVSVQPSKLKSVYEKLSDAYEDSEERASEVSDHIDRVEDVSEDLFTEWRKELDQIENRTLRNSSSGQLRASEAKYAELIKAMRRAESRMAPVLTAFKDNVLFLKHNLNAQAIASLKTELNGIENNVGALIREMETSIAESQSFIEDMELLQ